MHEIFDLLDTSIAGRRRQPLRSRRQRRLRRRARASRCHAAASGTYPNRSVRRRSLTIRHRNGASRRHVGIGFGHASVEAGVAGGLADDTDLFFEDVVGARPSASVHVRSCVPSEENSLPSSSKRRRCTNSVTSREGPVHDSDVADAQKPDEVASSTEEFPMLARYLKQANKLPDGAGGKRFFGDAGRYYGDAIKRTDDGYLTKLGAKQSCVVCCETGHKAHECPQARCFICFCVGHTTKTCPNAAMCGTCGMRGHGESGCIWSELKDASRLQALTSVRCLSCGQEGHLICRIGLLDPAQRSSCSGDVTRKASAFSAALLGGRGGCRVATSSASVLSDQDHGRSRQSSRGCGRGVNVDAGNCRSSNGGRGIVSGRVQNYGRGWSAGGRLLGRGRGYSCAKDCDIVARRSAACANVDDGSLHGSTSGKVSDSGKADLKEEVRRKLAYQHGKNGSAVCLGKRRARRKDTADSADNVCEDLPLRASLRRRARAKT